MAEKSEKATPKKLRDARKKGQVAKSQDFPAAFTFMVSMTGIVVGAGFIFDKLSSFMIAMFRSISHDIDMQNRAGGYINAAIQTIFSTSLPLLIAVVIVGVLVSFLIVGPTFSLEAMKPDIKRLNPVDGIKQKFKLKTFIELLKSIVKIIGALVLIYTVIRTSLPLIISAAALPPKGAAMIFSKFLVQVALRVGIFFLAVAIFDLIFQKRNFAKQMMMEKFEVKQEVKDTEGNPEIKGKRRQVAREIAYKEGPRAVKRARAVITNPTHLAVALEYDEEDESLPAPKVLTMGKGQIAEEIVKQAQRYNIPIMRNVPLAHELYDNCDIGNFIPEDTYKAVAEILKWVAELEHREEVEAEFLK